MNWLQIENEWVTALATMYPEPEAKSMFFLMLKHRFGFDKTYYLVHQQEEINDEQLLIVQNVLAELMPAKPIQYVLGETEFYDLNFRVNPSVLIPRPETEELVHWILEELSLRNLSNPILLDIGTGSGCIPIALKYKLPNATVHALDISADALATAIKNAELNGVEVHFIQQDILANEQAPFTTTFDVIVSNPPYVTTAEKDQMRSNVLDFEPHTALFVPDQDPLIFYDRIADFALRNLKPDGLLFFEINAHFGQQTLDLLFKKGFHSVELRKDLPGKDRMIKATR